MKKIFASIIAFAILAVTPALAQIKPLIFTGKITAVYSSKKKITVQDLTTKVKRTIVITNNSMLYFKSGQIVKVKTQGGRSDVRILSK